MVTRGAWDLNQLPNFSQKESVCVLLNRCLCGRNKGLGFPNLPTLVIADVTIPHFFKI